MDKKHTVVRLFVVAQPTQKDCTLRALLQIHADKKHTVVCLFVVAQPTQKDCTLRALLQIHIAMIADQEIEREITGNCTFVCDGEQRFIAEFRFGALRRPQGNTRLREDL